MEEELHRMKGEKQVTSDLKCACKIILQVAELRCFFIFNTKIYTVLNFGARLSLPKPFPSMYKQNYNAGIVIMFRNHLLI